MNLKKHEFVCGTTQSGKTYYSIQRGEEFNGAVFFWNPQSTKNNFTECQGRYIAWEDLEDLLARGGKISYIPVIDNNRSKEELRLIVNKLFKSIRDGKLKGKEILFIADECQIYARSGVGYTPIEDIATRGLALGLYGLFVTQRPALVSNTLFTQAEVKTYFSLEPEEWQYFKRNGVPIEQIQADIKKGGKYHYIQKANGEYTKAIKK